MRNSNAIIFASLILAAIATIFGIFGQNMAYFFNESFAKILPVYYLTVLTLMSVFLFLSSFVLMYLQYKKQKNKKGIFGAYFSVLFVIGLLTSYWSLFVLAMWWS